VKCYSHHEPQIITAWNERAQHAQTLRDRITELEKENVKLKADIAYIYKGLH
jgi:hypothetical protein